MSVTQLDEASVPAYLASVPALAAHIDAARIETVREVGDGNLNLVFVVTDTAGRSLVLKQSLPFVRTDPSWPMTRERTAREARVLAAHERLDPDHVPALLHFDAPQYVLAMADLSDHQVWRTLLNGDTAVEGASDEVRADDVEAARSLGQFIARVGFGTSVHGLGTAAHKAAVAASVNPELCEITEDLVFTEPFVEHAHNAVHPDNTADVAELAADPAVLRSAGLAKLAFMTRAESLLHGDLHTGSVLVRRAAAGVERSARAFDSEFGCYGPLGFDLGVLWGNYALAAARASALGLPRRARGLLALGVTTAAAFEDEWRALWPSRVDPRVYGDGVLTAQLAQIRRDAVAFAGTEVARRVIGFAKVADIETLPDAARVLAARRALRAAHALLRHSCDAPADALVRICSAPLES